MSSKFGNKSEPNTFLRAVNMLKTDQIPTLSLLLGIF